MARSSLIFLALSLESRFFGSSDGDDPEEELDEEEPDPDEEPDLDEEEDHEGDEDCWRLFPT